MLLNRRGSGGRNLLYFSVGKGDDECQVCSFGSLQEENGINNVSGEQVIGS